MYIYIWYVYTHAEYAEQYAICTNILIHINIDIHRNIHDMLSAYIFDTLDCIRYIHYLHIYIHTYLYIYTYVYVYI